MTTVLASSSVALPDGLHAGWLAVDDGLVVELGVGRVPKGGVDLGDRIVAPGFVDLQCNGLGTIDFASASPAEWRQARRMLARHGVTSFCPTFVTAPRDAYRGLLDAAASAHASSTPDESSVLGVHLEGPFLGGAPRAHDPALVGPVDLDWLRELVQCHPGLVRLITLAPEADPDLSATRWLAGSGIVVALGHTTASYDDALAAADAGATAVTHLFNGMSPWHHREPGVAGAALVDDRLTPTLIADLVHVHSAGLRLAFAGSRVVVVSDAVGTAGRLTARDGAAQLPDGTLAGSTTLLDGALANLVATGIPWHRAIAAVTSEPAQLLGCADRGVLEPGRRADLVALDPTTFAVERAWLFGVEQREPPLA
jgi:N-acetylglucosamine-6-phosphate deacetylase